MEILHIRRDPLLRGKHLIYRNDPYSAESSYYYYVGPGDEEPDVNGGVIVHYRHDPYSAEGRYYYISFDDDMNLIGTDVITTPS